MNRPRVDEAVFITGASTGIGRTCALYLDALGYTVFAGVRKEADAQSLTNERPSLRPVLVDVVKRDQVLAVLRTVKAAELPLRAVVNNASIGPGGPLELIPIDRVRDIIEVNLVGSIYVSQVFTPLLRETKGRLVFVGSTAGVAAPPLLAPYAASKHGIEAIADALRLELMPWKIGVSLVQPGAIKTPIWDKGHEAVAQLRQSDPLVDTLYHDAVDLLNDTASRAQRFGIPPLRVAKAVAHAVTARRPKTRYAVGLDAKMLTTLRHFMPDRLWDFLLTVALGVPRRPPALPAATSTDADAPASAKDAA